MRNKKKPKSYTGHNKSNICKKSSRRRWKTDNGQNQYLRRLWLNFF